MNGIVVNTRVLHRETTGVQRYAQELLSRFPDRAIHVSPQKILGGMAGHAWEQFVLPARTHGKVLFSPSNSGPVMVRRQVVTIHDLVPLEHPEWLNPSFAHWYRVLLPRLMHAAERIISVSYYTKWRIIELCGIAEEKIDVIWNGVGSDFSPRDAHAVDQVRRRYGIPEGDYVVAVGTLSRRKNLGRLLLAWKQIVKTLDRETILVIVGSEGRKAVFGGNGLGELPPEAMSIGHVPDSDMPALYSGAIASVFPSLYEGFGLPPLESMACGTPVVASAVTAIPEVVGDAAVLVDPYKVASIAEGLAKLLRGEALRSKLRQRGLARVKEFSWDVAAGRTLRSLDSIS